MSAEQDQLLIKSKSTFKLLLGIWIHLSTRRRFQLGWLFAVMLLSGLAELLSLGAVLPFLAVISDPQKLWQQPWIEFLAFQAKLVSPNQLLLPTTIVFISAVILAVSVRLINLWFNERMAAAIGSDLSGEVYRRTLYQPYEVHLKRNSSIVINTITTQVQRSVWAFKAFFDFATSAVVAIALFIGLLIVDWKLAFGAALLFGTAYYFIAEISRRKLARNSVQITMANSQLVKAVQEGLGAIRDVIIDGSQQYYLSTYREADRLQRGLSARNDFLAQSPRYLLEALGMLAIALLGYLLVDKKGGEANPISVLGFLALGAQRLLPALQSIFRSWANVKGFYADLDGVIVMLNQPLPVSHRAEARMKLNQSIQLQGVRFHYGPEQPEVLKALDLEIRRGERIGLVGSTGSGKSTMVDLLMGLLVPSGGRLLVDGLDLHDPMHPERLQAWRAAIAHVPQSIYLTDSSFAENIAFGIPREQIDMVRVRNAASQAQIASFIEESISGYNTHVGECGIRLSGGQRQRIGIARALYKQADVLFLDEATSALDNATESAVMEVVDSFSKELTVVMIAHRLTTVKNCDRVIQLSNGTFLEDGS